jgi:thiamine kinase-like enzyme
VQPEQIAARLWPGRDVRLEPLGGGITNRNFKVAVGGETLVLRIGGKDTGLLGIDRRAEYEASLAAASIGVGPEVVAFAEAEGCLVTRFIDGSPIPPERVRSPETLRSIGQTLRAVHDGPSMPGRFDSFRVVEQYRDLAVERGVELPAAYEEAHELARAIEGARRGTTLRACHNDLLNANFIDDGARVRIVDWEYAGMGDPLFDLANFSINHELDEAANRALLRAYAGEPREQEAAALELMRFMSDFREAMWGVVQQAISELDFDFRAYADEHFERLQRTAANAGFRRALPATQPPPR